MRGIMICLLFWLIACGRSEAAESRPNIVLILADDLGYGDPRCFNAESKIPTERLDALARAGMRFTDAHAPGSVCVPSRYGLLTGRYPVRAELKWQREAVIEADRTTIASFLKSAGYATAMVGKWHQGFDGGPAYDFQHPLVGGPCDRGFDHYFGLPASLDIPPYYYIRDRRAVAAPTERAGANSSPGWTRIQGAFWREGGIAPGFEFEKVLPQLTDEAVAQVTRLSQQEAPFFLYVALPAPHTPWLPLKPFRGQSGAGMYGDFVLQVDSSVGCILDALRKSGVEEETLIIFTSDNGPVWYPQDVEKFEHASAGPLRGMKGDAWEGGHRMPLIVRWPERVAAGSQSDQLLCFTDFLATFAEIVDRPLPEGAGPDSVSFLPALFGRADDELRQELVLTQNGAVFREGKWKLITHLGSGGFSSPRKIQPTAGGPRGQLYNLAEDLSEQNNLWQRRPEVVARLERKLRAALGK